jgi:hypothetical protein
VFISLYNNSFKKNSESRLDSFNLFDTDLLSSSRHQLNLATYADLYFLYIYIYIYIYIYFVPVSIDYNVYT